MITVCLIPENPCREIVEGRAEKKFLRTVPWQEFRPPLPRAAQAYEDILAIPVGNGHGRRQPFRMAAILDAFRATAPGEFTTREFSEFARGQGLEVEANTIHALLKRSKNVAADGATGKYQRRRWRFTA